MGGDTGGLDNTGTAPNTSGGSFCPCSKKDDVWCVRLISFRARKTPALMIALPIL